MSYTVKDITTKAMDNGVNANSTSADVNSKIGLAEKVVGGTFWDKEDDRVVANSKTLIRDGFHGDGHKAAIFLSEAHGKTSVANLDYNELVESGAATKLARLKETDPAAYRDILDSKQPYKSAADLTAAIDRASAPKIDPSATKPGVMVAKNTDTPAPVDTHKPPVVAEHKTPVPHAHTPDQPPVLASNTGPGNMGDHILSDATHILSDIRAGLGATAAGGALLGTADKILDTLKDFSHGGQILTAGNFPILDRIMDVMADIKLDNLTRFDPNGKEALPTGINPGPNLPDPMAGLSNNTMKLS
jgi:hypothetical protein